MNTPLLVVVLFKVNLANLVICASLEIYILLTIMIQTIKKESLEGIQKSFVAESREDLVSYFNFLAKETDRLLGVCAEKKEALFTLEKFLAGKIEDDEQIKKMLPSKAKAEEASDNLKVELKEFEREFEIIETLFNSCMSEIKSRITVK